MKETWNAEEIQRRIQEELNKPIQATNLASWTNGTPNPSWPRFLNDDLQRMVDRVRAQAHPQNHKIFYFRGTIEECREALKRQDVRLNQLEMRACPQAKTVLIGTPEAFRAMDTLPTYPPPWEFEP